MSVYIVGFGLSISCLYFAESKRFKGRASKIAVMFALFLPCLIAGLRDRTIGTDIRVYTEPLYQCAQIASSFADYLSSNYFSVWEYIPISEMEIGFSVLIYVLTKLFNSLPVVLFSIQALTVIPIYKGLRAYSNSQPVWLGMAVYYLMYYNQTMNMMRQWIAMAFLFYGFQFLTKKQNNRYFLVLVMAFLFHNTAVLGLVVFGVYLLCAKENAYNRKIKALLLILLGVFSIFSLDFFVIILKWLGLDYGNYISGSLKFMPNQFLYRIPLVLLFLLRWKNIRKHNPYSNFYVVMIAYDLLMSQLTSIYANSGRVGLYFSEYYMLAYPAVCRASNNKKNRQVLRLLVLCYLCVYWWYLYVYKGMSETIPYKLYF